MSYYIFDLWLNSHTSIYVSVLSNLQYMNRYLSCVIYSSTENSTANFDDTESTEGLVLGPNSYTRRMNFELWHQRTPEATSLLVQDPQSGQTQTTVMYTKWLPPLGNSYQKY